MTNTTVQRETNGFKQVTDMSVRAGCLIGLMSLVSGCGSPPAVTALLQASQRAVAMEVTAQQTDLVRDAQMQEERRAALSDGFEMDLVQRATLDAAWVRSATQGYVAAMVELTRHEEALKAQRLQRIDNLQTAQQAQLRALQLLQMQDQWLQGTLGLDLWRLEQSRLVMEQRR